MNNAGLQTDFDLRLRKGGGLFFARITGNRRNTSLRIFRYSDFPSFVNKALRWRDANKYAAEFIIRRVFDSVLRDSSITRARIKIQKSEENAKNKITSRCSHCRDVRRFDRRARGSMGHSICRRRCRP
ncbi:hypothetical protein [Paraburkholderia eburnea]|uniref:hypothetical protein n=1 Tax=Paraburkholderia eburnea TaxID=1189126 RepID=UPI00142D1D8D|nr:hypothetical protein [Paraburkholderia eburnea]